MRRFNFIYVAATLIALLVASLACDLPVEFAAQGENLDATETMHALATRVAGTLEPESDDQGISEPGDSQGEAVASSPTVTLTPTVTPTPTLGVPMVSVSVDTNCRFGPGDVYEYQGALMVGEEAEVVGKLSNESFWYITNPDAPPPYCWIWGMYAQVVGDKSGIPILTPPPTPTATPVPLAFQATFQGGLFCNNVHLILVRIENTGSVAIEYFDLKVVDTTMNLVTTHAEPNFVSSYSCTAMITTPIERIKPGEVYYAFVPGLPFFSFHTYEATITLCSQIDECETKMFSTP